MSLLPFSGMSANCKAYGIEEGTYWYCEHAPFAKGLCQGHYQQDRRGKPLRPLGASLAPARSKRVTLDVDEADAETITQVAKARGTTAVAIYREAIALAAKVYRGRKGKQ